MSPDPVDLLSCSLDQVATVIARIEDDRWERPTPCRSWDVRALVGHLVDELEAFRARAEDRPPGSDAAATRAAPEDALSAFRTGATALLEAWRRRPHLDGVIQVPGMGELPARFPVDQQMTEFAIHAWDIVRATGQPTELDPEIGQASLDWARQALRPAFRGDEESGKVFGPEVPVPDDAPVYDRLAGFFGRTP